MSSSVTVLNTELYSTREAARLLHIHSVTLKRWLEGATRKGVFYEPVLRPEPTGRDSVSWGEFVEAGLLREYRRRGVKLQTMRGFIARLREELGVPFPLAHETPYIAGKDLVRRVQDEMDLSRDLWVVSTGPKEGQLVLAPAAERFVDMVEFRDDVAGRMYPMGKSSPVSIDPRKSFGIPTVRGIRTENVGELFQAGESVESIADAFDLEIPEVEAALRFESAA